MRLHDLSILYIAINFVWFQVLRYFVLDTKNESLEWERLHYSPHLHDLLTLHPVHNLSHMTQLHRYCRERRIARLHRLISTIEPKGESGCHDNGESTHNCSNRPPLTNSSVPKRFYPRNKYELKSWTHVDYRNMHISDISNPALPLIGEDLGELDYIIKNAMDIISEQDGEKYQSLKLQNGYTRYSGLRGREYILDLLLRVQDSAEVVQRRISLLRHHSSDLVILPDSRENSERINFIVPLSSVGSRFTEFLTMYEKLCLTPSDNCRLIVVVYGSDDEIQLTRQKLQAFDKYPNVEYIISSSRERFARARALDLAMSFLGGKDLAFLCDVDMSIDPSFLNRCRLNTIPRRRVYYPIFFKYYDMDYVYRFKRRPATFSIKREHGHWASYSYGMLCIYKSDYTRAGGFDTSIEGWGGEDVDLLDRILTAKLEVLRAPDPALRHRYHDKVCSARLNPTQLSMCISSRSECLADRMQLANYVFYLEDTCGVNARTLWTMK